MNIPIIICVKSRSERCPNKNIELLPYTLEYCNKCDEIENVHVVSDSDIFMSITNKYNINKYYIENRKEDWDELDSIYNYTSENNIDKFIVLPVIAPLRDESLILNVTSQDLDEYDLITSYVVLQDRYLYQIEDQENFFIKGIGRKGTMCEYKYFADGAIYYTTNKFISKCILSEDPNLTFWNSKTKFILNDAPFVNINTIDDLLKFKKYYNKRYYNWFDTLPTKIENFNNMITQKLKNII